MYDIFEKTNGSMRLLLKIQNKRRILLPEACSLCAVGYGPSRRSRCLSSTKTSPWS